MILELKVSHLHNPCYHPVKHAHLNQQQVLISIKSISLFYLHQYLDLTKKTMVHEGPLSWKVNKDKTIGL